MEQAPLAKAAEARWAALSRPVRVAIVCARYAATASPIPPVAPAARRGARSAAPV